VPTQTRTSHDTLTRVTTEQLWTRNTLKWQTTYGHDGDRKTVFPPTGGASRTEWDVEGRTTRLRVYPTSDATGTPETTSYGYDRVGQLTSITDPANHTTSYSYDVGGRRRSTQDPDTGTATSVYNPAGDVTSSTDGRGQKLSFEYDPLGRPTTRWAGEVGTGTRLASFGYDTLASGATAKGHPTSATRYDNGGQYLTAVAGYTDDYQPTGQSWTIPVGEGQLAGTYRTSMTYNPHTGAPATVSYPAAPGVAAETVTYGYDPLGHPTTLTGQAPYVTATGFTAFGQLSRRVHGDPGPGQLTRNYTFDTATGRLTSIAATTPHPLGVGQPQTVQHDTYTYTPTGDVTAIKDNTDNQSQCYRYDHQHRLTEAWTATDTCTTNPTTTALATSGKHPYWDSWTFDKAGRRTTDTHRTATTATTRTYTYPTTAGAPRPHAMTSVTKTGAGAGVDTFSYDNAGNTDTRTIAGLRSDYTFDAENRFSKAEVHATGGTQ